MSGLKNESLSSAEQRLRCPSLYCVLLPLGSLLPLWISPMSLCSLRAIQVSVQATICTVAVTPSADSSGRKKTAGLV